ncbi:hypothetical protein [Absidia glauca]|uniref:Peptidase S54 rhomboid domain-containing protein n=1 Tax=Absidia glauca TaxID=4829 RepID=A0A163JYF1_ABSGL|nr:hypothetical protein [Absidia glauca]
MIQYSRLAALVKHQHRHAPLYRYLPSATRGASKGNPSTTGTVYVSQRSFIRPRHHDRPLSSALKQQNNPFHKLGRMVNNVDPNTVLWSVIGINVGVFGLWQYGISSYRQFGDPALLEFMLDHFLNSPDGWEHHRWHTLLTSAFSHKNLDHLGINMLVLYSMGKGVIEAIGASRFLLLYCGAGIAGSLGTMLYREYLRPAMVNGTSNNGRAQMQPLQTVGSLGASGSVMGLTTFFACAFPKSTFLVFFVVPMPAIAVVGLFAAYDFYNATRAKASLVDSAAHIGGATYGAAYWFLRVKPLLRAGRWRV